MKKEKVNIFTGFFQDRLFSRDFLEDHSHIMGIIGSILIFLT
jgi:hypothetical protein